MMYATNDAKSQCKPICIIGYTKLTKSDKISSLEMCTIHYKVFCIGILHHFSMIH
jgi:hypothetical protein